MADILIANIVKSNTIIIFIAVKWYLSYLSKWIAFLSLYLFCHFIIIWKGDKIIVDEYQKVSTILQHSSQPLTNNRFT